MSCDRYVGRGTNMLSHLEIIGFTIKLSFYWNFRLWRADLALWCLTFLDWTRWATSNENISPFSRILIYRLSRLTTHLNICDGRTLFCALWHNVVIQGTVLILRTGQLGCIKEVLLSHILGLRWISNRTTTRKLWVWSRAYLLRWSLNMFWELLACLIQKLRGHTILIALQDRICFLLAQ